MQSPHAQASMDWSSPLIGQFVVATDGRTIAPQTNISPDGYKLTNVYVTN